MMRLFRSIGSVLGFAGGLCAFVVAASLPRHAAAQVETDPGGTLRLPLPVEDIEAPERLDEIPRSGAGFSGRVTTRDGALTATGASARLLRGSWGACGTVWYGAGAAGGREPIAATGEIEAARGRLHAVLGRLDVRGTGVLFGERLSLASRASRLPSARAGAPRLGAPGSAWTRGLEGVGVRWQAPAGSSGARCVETWAVAARRSGGAESAVEAPEGELAAMGATVPIGGSTVVAPSMGWSDGSLTASVAARSWSDAWDAGAEAVISRAGFAALADAGVAAPPFRWRGRWRFREGDARPIAGEVSAEAASRLARLLVRVSGGASGATGAVERRELEGWIGTRRGLGPLVIRLGRTGTTGFTAAEGFVERRERYAVLELEVARSGGRALAWTASRRERATGAGRRAGTSTGGRLDVRWRRRGRLEVRVEAVRAEPDAPAWSSGVYAGGATALRSRTRPGVALSARGELRAGTWRLGGVVEGREDEQGRRATAATLWIEKRIPFLTRGSDTRTSRG